MKRDEEPLNNQNVHSQKKQLTPLYIIIKASNSAVLRQFKTQWAEDQSLEKDIFPYSQGGMKKFGTKCARLLPVPVQWGEMFLLIV